MSETSSKSSIHRVRVRDTTLYSVYYDSLADRPAEDFIPDDNAQYKNRAYWDERFAKEPSYEWLGAFQHVREGYEATGIDFSLPNQTALVVGCGNSTFSRDLSIACPSWSIASIDFSKVVVEKMRRKYPQLVWIEQDMTNLQFPTESFDLVLDKAAMDALVSDEGSSWDPSESSCKSVDDMVASAARVLKPSGKLAIVTFQPVHFRRRHLERAMSKCLEYRWLPDIKVVQRENVDLGTEFAVFTLTRCS